MWAAMVAIYFGFGMTVAAIPPMIDVVRSDLSLGRGAMGIALSAWTALYIVVAPLAGRAVDRLGVGTSLIVGGVGTIATLIARSFATGLVSLWLAVGIMGLTGPLISASAPTLCAQWFSDLTERRRAMSLYNLGPGLGSIAAIVATNSVLLPQLGTWRRVLVFEAAVAGVLLALCVVVVLRAPSPPPPTREPVRTLDEWRGLIGSRSVRHMLLLGTCSFFVMHSLGNWQIDALASHAGLGTGAASNWVAVSGLIGMGLLFFNARIVGTIGQQRTIIMVWVFLIVGMAMIGLGVTTAGAIGTLFTSWRSLMIPLLLLSLMEAKGVTTDNMGAANGLWFAAAQIGAVAGPTVVGLVADSRLGYPGAMGLLSCVALITLVLVNRGDPEKLPAS